MISLSGNLFMKAGRSAFPEADAALHALDGKVDHVLVDMHAEATSEKVAMGWHLDGRVTAVVGTHTHVPTADARVLPGGTAYITDVGMTGPRGGVIGVKRDQAVTAMVTQMPIRFETSTEDPWLNAVVIRADEPMRAARSSRGPEPAPGRCGGSRWSPGSREPTRARRNFRHSPRSRRRVPDFASVAGKIRHDGPRRGRVAEISRLGGGQAALGEGVPGAVTARRQRRARGLRRPLLHRGQCLPQLGREAGEQRHRHQRVEPHDVGVEPVGGAKLQCDQDRGAEGSDLDEAPPAGDEHHRDGHRHGGALDEVLFDAEASPQPPDRERVSVVPLRSSPVM